MASFAPWPGRGALRARRLSHAMPEDAAWYTRRWLPLTVQFYEALIEQLWLTPGDRLLDLACGPGALVAQVAPIVGPFGRDQRANACRLNFH